MFEAGVVSCNCYSLMLHLWTLLEASALVSVSGRKWGWEWNNPICFRSHWILVKNGPWHKIWPNSNLHGADSAPNVHSQLCDEILYQFFFCHSIINRLHRSRQASFAWQIDYRSERQTLSTLVCEAEPHGNPHLSLRCWFRVLWVLRVFGFRFYLLPPPSAALWWRRLAKAWQNDPGRKSSFLRWKNISKVSLALPNLSVRQDFWKFLAKSTI